MNNVKLEVDTFNTSIFDMKMGNIVLDTTLNVDINDILNVAKNEGYKHLTCKIPTNEKTIVNSFEDLGFRIADTLVTYSFQFDKCNLTDIKYICQTGDCSDEDVDVLKRISKESFKLDRFHSDPNLNDDNCDLYYEKWFENSYNGFADKVGVAYFAGEPVGFTTGKYVPNSQHAHLVLSAVDLNKRGLGIYTTLIHYMTKWAIDLSYENSDLKDLLVGTQIDNIAVQKAWNKLGYFPYSSDYVLQIML